MIQKDLSVTEYIGILSVVTLVITVISNFYFYWYLDALWVLSVLSPTVYVVEIFKVSALLLLALLAIGLLMASYGFLVRVFYRKKKKLRLSSALTKNNQMVLEQLIRLEKYFLCGRYIFVVAVFSISAAFLRSIGVVTFSTMSWFAVLSGAFFGVITDSEIKKDRALRFFCFGILIVIATCFSAHLKVSSVQSLPDVVLKQKDGRQWQLLDASADKFVLIEKHKNREIKMLTLGEIDRIIPHQQ